MTFNGLFVCEGTSDQPLADHVARMFSERNCSLVLRAPDFALLPEKVGAGVEGKLRAARKYGGRYDLIVVHRDSDNQGIEARRLEISAAADRVFPTTPAVAVIPVRMTEAWLLLDEWAIRSVADNPNGRRALDLPGVRDVERVADPKQRLREVLVLASECSGRRLDIFKRRFAAQRRILLERLDPAGPVAGLQAWQSVVSEVERAVKILHGGTGVA